MSGAPTTDLMRTLAGAARLAQRAPSVFNTQPWQWRVGSHTLDLLRDSARRLSVTDPDSRQLTISCGAALHHARTALAAAGRRIVVSRLPDPAQPDLLARIEVAGREVPDPQVRQLRGAIPRRRTDRRPFAATPVPEATMLRLGQAAQAEGCAMHVVRIDQMPMLAIATAQAAQIERADAAYRSQLTEWTDRPPGSGDGVPATTAVQRTPRRVPVRDFAVDTSPGLDAGEGDDHGARYAILYGDDDSPAAWLRAGEALSAVLLTAVVERISTSPMTDVLEVDRPRRLVQGLLPHGRPYLLLRLGVPLTTDAPPLTPRRRTDTTIRFG